MISWPKQFPVKTWTDKTNPLNEC